LASSEPSNERLGFDEAKKEKEVPVPLQEEPKESELANQEEILKLQEEIKILQEEKRQLNEEITGLKLEKVQNSPMLSRKESMRFNLEEEIQRASYWTSEFLLFLFSVFLAWCFGWFPDLKKKKKN